MTTTIEVQDIAPLAHEEAAVLAAEENARFVALLASIAPEDWTRQTDCTEWDVRAMAGHVLAGFEADISMVEFARQAWAGRRAAGNRPFIDGLTEVGVRKHAHLTSDEVLARLTELAHRAAAARSGTPALMRKLPLRFTLPDGKETWRLGYLLDVIETRDVWMHRVDLARATGRELQLTPEHDGRIVADVVAEWARRHGRPFTLHLDGPAGGHFRSGDDGERMSLDAVEFCRLLSGRGTSEGLLSQLVPF
jgi:uncharacterized protein (TIGR03083 family)